MINTRRSGRRGGRGTGPRANEDRNVHNNENPENPPNAHLNEQQRAEMNNEFARMLQAAIPTIVAEVRRASEGNNGNGAGSGATNTVGGGGNPEDHGEQPVMMGPRQDRGCSYKAFCEGKPPPFEGKRDALITAQWVKEMDAVVNISECRPDQAVKYVAHSFKDEAIYWWDSVKETLGDQAIAAMTWNDLKQLIFLLNI